MTDKERVEALLIRQGFSLEILKIVSYKALLNNVIEREGQHD